MVLLVPSSGCLDGLLSTFAPSSPLAWATWWFSSAPQISRRQIVHAVAIGKHPIDQIALVHIVNHVRGRKVERVNGVALADDLGETPLVVFSAVRWGNSDNSRRRKSLFRRPPPCARSTAYKLRFGCITAISAAGLEILGKSVDLIQRRSQRLILCHLPEPDTGFHCTVLFIMGDELKQRTPRKGVKSQKPKDTPAIFASRAASMTSWSKSGHSLFGVSFSAKVTPLPRR